MRIWVFIFFVVLGFRLQAQFSLTVGEVYDFQIGDEFHITGKGQGQTANCDRVKIVGKYFSASRDTVFYIRFHDSYASMVINDSLVYGAMVYTDTVSYTKLDSWISSDSTVWFGSDSCIVIKEYSEQYCDSLVNGYSCEANPFEPVYYSRVFGKGLGMVRDYYEQPVSLWMFDNVLIYYQRNGIGCGTPDSTYVGIQPHSADLGVSLYPNPANDYILIENHQCTDVLVSLTSADGVPVLQVSVNQQTNRVDCSKLPGGFYLAEITGCGKRLVKRLIIL